MKKIMIFALAVMGLSTCMVYAGLDEWQTNFEQAKKIALEKKQPIMAVFSGSDWCAWCMKLEKEVLAKDEFKNYAKTSLVLFVADFPSSHKLKEEVTKQNQELAEKYGVKGFPTVLILSGDGKVLAKTGYRPGGAEKYVEHLKDLIKG
ncbi:MAG: thioredoxin family protein [Kiritimatiellae bacterium]|nr:thioredoxin family protein [Kiritimatiellia bacterium]MDD5520540.1 thioredoxin family protein [Kiritimatiellia bacterium]